MVMAQPLTLFVDDVPSLLGIIKSNLLEIGYKAVEVAPSVDEAMKVISNRHVTHVVSDLKMEKPGGMAFLRRVRQENPSIRCTLLSGFISDLSEADRDSLASIGIELEDKKDVSTAWLARLVGFKDYVPAIDQEEDADWAIPDVIVSGPADIIAKQRLRIEELERSILFVAEDLVRDLERIKESDVGRSIIGGKSRLSVKDLVREIKMLTPMGRRLIELDRAAGQRVAKRLRDK
jgi:CheY-like chemotaxis protein